MSRRSDSLAFLQGRVQRCPHIAQAPVRSPRADDPRYHAASAVLEQGRRTWLFRTEDERARFLRDNGSAMALAALPRA